MAAKLSSVLSLRMAMRLNCLSLQKKFSIRCRHLYISSSIAFGFAWRREPERRPLIGPRHRKIDQTRDPKPRGRRPSIAALTMSSGRNASDSVIEIERSVLPSRAAIGQRRDVTLWSERSKNSG